MSFSGSFRSLMGIAMFIALAITMAFNAPQAQAQDCCGFGIGNSTDCSFRVTLVVNGGERVLVVPPGGDSWTIPDCLPFRLKVNDACGVEHYLPNIVGQCITVYMGPGCCLEICKVSTCRWEAHYTHCLPCY